MLTFYAPASVGNVSVGFDVLGAAVTPIDGSLLGDCLRIEQAEQFSLSCVGQFAHALPAEKEQNIVYQCWQRFCAELGQEVAVSLRLEKNMPIGSGLGSSACSVVAAFLAMNEYCQRPLTQQQLLLLMGELEGRISGSIHYDNVAPCYLGGIQLILEGREHISQQIPGFEHWLWVMAYPGISLSTAQARKILPAHYSRQDCIRHGRNLGGFIHACHSQQSQLAAEMMEDIIGEPYRAGLIPGFSAAKSQMQQLGALACGISGAGPTLMAISDNLSTAQQLVAWLRQHYVQNEQGFVHICRLDSQGARRLE